MRMHTEDGGDRTRRIERTLSTASAGILVTLCLCGCFSRPQ
jgi:hypothetical protein